MMFPKKRLLYYESKNQIGDTIHLIWNRETNKLDSLLYLPMLSVSKDTLGTGLTKLKENPNWFFKDNEFSKA